MACRVVPVLKAICADAEKACPSAWIIIYTNPTQYVADAVRRISQMKIISLCDGFLEDAEEIARLLEVDPAEVVVYPGGSNHAMWILNFTVKGEPGYPLLRKKLDSITAADLERLYSSPDSFTFNGVPVTRDQIYKQFILHNGILFALKLYELYGLLLSPRYYPRYHYDQEQVIAEEQSGHYVTMANFYMQHAVPRMFEDLDHRLEQTSRHLTTERRRGGGSHGDLAVRVMDAIVNNTSEISDVNVPNHGSVSNLPYDSILELAALVDRSGAHPFAVGPLPRELLGYQYSLVLAQELAIDAAISGSRSDLLKAILAHPLVNSITAAEKAMDELLSLQAEWLPQFIR